ncbi:hypothetical protein BCR33DRAFT_721997 [Rhizoclosmatium globosum]|uniref:G-protein coupled receptors family 1 profile domain-containing protein n=1 Tax=Rhizoclosmatium globosum TaxID=329046 RepID=A0A1Y2BP02_9FUNG|nr:hypothetical protein BCR33DRAFT_721997 [Rhizoclosmatium globosum]|eukprot:ORY36474.1 hypothetical protein BCR33DRAFT_721997 [Rhizoclosmatium globosum]
MYHDVYANGILCRGSVVFPLASLAVAAVYENTYFLVAEVFEKYDHESNRRTSRVLMEESIKVQKSALIRCVLMSIGLVVFYVPSIVLIFAGTANEALLVNFSANQPLLFSVTTLPSLDPLWSAIMILVFQVEFQEAYLASIRRVWARIRHSKT